MDDPKTSFSRDPSPTVGTLLPCVGLPLWEACLVSAVGALTLKLWVTAQSPGVHSNIDHGQRMWLKHSRVEKSLTNILPQDRIQRPRVLSDLCNHDRPSRDLNKGRVSADADADVETQRRGAARLGIRSRRGGAGPLSQDPDTTAGVCAKPPDCSPDPLG